MLHCLLLRLMAAEKNGELLHSVGETRLSVLGLFHLKEFAIDFNNHFLKARIIVL